jgi:hypothetical protein
MELVVEKAFFEKANVVALIDSLPDDMQETALFIALGKYKRPSNTNIGIKGIKVTDKGETKVYTLESFNPYTKRCYARCKSEKYNTWIGLDEWNVMVINYQNYLKEIVE